MQLEARIYLRDKFNRLARGLQPATRIYLRDKLNRLARGWQPATSDSMLSYRIEIVLA